MEPLKGTTSEPEERFLRGRVSAPRASRRLTRRRIASFLGVLGLGAAGLWVVLASGRAPELAVHRILVEGNDRLSDGEILELIEVGDRTSILTLDLDELRTRLLRSAWVRDVELKRVLPATLTLEIVERTPVAVAVLDELYLLAEDGTILDQLPPHYDASKLVLARGLATPSGAVSAERAVVAGRLAEALSADERLAVVVSELDVTEGPRSVALRLREPRLTLLATAETTTERLTAVLPLLSGIRERFPAVAVVDLRFQGCLYLQLNEITPGEVLSSAVIVPGGASF